MNEEEIRKVEALVKLAFDIKIAHTLAEDEVRFLVSAYYTMQESRKRTSNQIRNLELDTYLQHLYAIYPSEKHGEQKDAKVALSSILKKKPNDGKKTFNEVYAFCKHDLKLRKKRKDGMPSLDEWLKELKDRHDDDIVLHMERKDYCPHDVLTWFDDNYRKLEANLKKILHEYALSKPIGRWMLDICGIGPVIAAGLLAHLDIRKAKTAGAFQRFGGYDPTQEWNKGEKRPWNAELKTLYWKIGESFEKTKNRESSHYGPLLIKRKEFEESNNLDGMYTAQAEKKLKDFNIGKTTEAYKWYSKGMLPPAHINQRAKRWTTKIFLCHLFEVWYEHEYKKPAPECYPLAHLDGHVHKLDPPGNKPS